MSCESFLNSIGIHCGNVVDLIKSYCSSLKLFRPDQKSSDSGINQCLSSSDWHTCVFPNLNVYSLQRPYKWWRNQIWFASLDRHFLHGWPTCVILYLSFVRPFNLSFVLSNWQDSRIILTTWELQRLLAALNGFWSTTKMFMLLAFSKTRCFTFIRRKCSWLRLLWASKNKTLYLVVRLKVLA